MKKLISVSTALGICLVFLFLQTNVSSCKKQTIHDTVYVNKPDTCSYTLQPHSADEILYLGNPSYQETDPNPPELCAAAWTTNGNYVDIHSVFKFDLQDIPANATIVSARLTLYTNPTPLIGDHVNANSGPANSMLIQRVSSSWNKTNNGTWATQPPATAADQVVIPHTSAPFLDLVDVDVAKLVQEMVKTNNYGFKIRLQTEAIYNSRVFCSSRYPNAAKHPKLVVKYTKKS